MANQLFQNYLFTDAGAAIVGATVDLLDRNTTTPVRATTTTDANGLWSISHGTEGRFDVRITNGSSVRWHKYDTQSQIDTLEVANFNIRNPADTFDYAITPGAITADRILNLPVITGTDTLAVLGLAQTFTADQTFNDNVNVTLGTGGDADLYYDGTDVILNARVVGTGNVDFRQYLTWGGGVAMTAGDYAVGRNADGTNLLQLNVPTGASFEFSVNDVAQMTLSATAVDFQDNSITTTGALTIASFGGNWTNAGRTVADLGIVTTVDINGGTIDGVTLTGGTLAGTIAGTPTFSGASINFAGDTVVDGEVIIIGPAALTPATADYVRLGITDIAAGDARFGIQSEAGSVIYLGNDRLRFAAATGIIGIGATDVISMTTTVASVPTADLRVTTAGTDATSVVTVGGTQTLTAKTLTSPTIGTSPTAAGATWTDLGTVTTVDINGGTLDGVTIGGAAAAAGTFTTLVASGVGPHGIGVAAAAGTSLSIKTSVTATGGTALGVTIGTGGTLTAAANSDSLWNTSINSTTFAKGAYTGLDAAMLRIAGSDMTASGAGTIATAVLARLDSLPTIGTVNAVFALPTDATDPTAGGGAAAGRIPILIGGAVKYMAYY